MPGPDAKLFIIAKAKSTIHDRSCSEYPSPGVASTWIGTNFYELLFANIKFLIIMSSLGEVSSLKSNAGIAWNFWKISSEVACICSIDAKLYMLARAILVISKSLSSFIPCSAQGASPGLSSYSLFSSRSHPSFL